MIRTSNLLTICANTMCVVGLAFMLACNALPDPWRMSMMDAAVWNLVAAGPLYLGALIAAVLSLRRRKAVPPEYRLSIVPSDTAA